LNYKFGNIKIYKFDPRHEEDNIEAVLSSIAPVTKTVSLMPHTPKGVYLQSPEEGVSEIEYYKLKSQIKTIDWSSFVGSDGEDEKYCQGDKCDVPL